MGDDRDGVGVGRAKRVLLLSRTTTKTKLCAMRSPGSWLQGAWEGVSFWDEDDTDGVRR
jgi:hypothetical protein